MLSRIELRNFKRFDHFLVRAQPGNILVGPNNSGKSSILDALRVFEACYRFSKQKNPSLIEIDGDVYPGYQIPESYLPLSLDNITHNYNENDASILITHQNKNLAIIKLHPNRAVKFAIDANGQRLSSATRFRAAFPASLVIVPPLSPLESKEVFVTDETVNRNKATRLAARSFRNIWYRESIEDFEIFRTRVEAAWPGVSLQKPELVREDPPRLEMFFQENRITREIQWAGYGFQVWLQIHTHLLRGEKNSILVLDEPDIYLHPDLQHRLYHDTKRLFSQYFFATHATEIINEADTKEILVIDPESRSAKSIKGDKDYEEMLSYIGSAENADFAKIARIKKLIFVEGHDAKILRRIASKLSLERLSIDRDSPIFQLGGFSQWKRAINTIWAFKELLGIEVQAICLFDRDYRSQEEVLNFVAEIQESGIECFVLERKEIENYLLCPHSIARLCSTKNENCGLNEEELQDIIEREAEDLKDSVLAHISTNHLRYQKECRTKQDDSVLLRKSIEVFNKEWASFSGKIRLAPGKELLKKVLANLKTNYNVSISPFAIAAALRRSEIPDELATILQRMDRLFA